MENTGDITKILIVWVLLFVRKNDLKPFSKIGQIAYYIIFVLNAFVSIQFYSYKRY